MEVLKRDNAGEPSHFEMKFVWETLRSPLSWLITAVYVGYVSPLPQLERILKTCALKHADAPLRILALPPHNYQ